MNKVIKVKRKLKPIYLPVTQSCKWNRFSNLKNSNRTINLNPKHTQKHEKIKCILEMQW